MAGPDGVVAVGFQGFDTPFVSPRDAHRPKWPIVVMNTSPVELDTLIIEDKAMLSAKAK